MENTGKQRFAKGTRVAHPTREDWGVGEVLEDEKNDTVRVFFAGVGEKTLRVDHVALEILEGVKAEDTLLDNLRNQSGQFRKLSGVITEFSSKYPGGFQGERYLGEERTYKVEAAKKVTFELGELELESLIKSSNIQEAARRIRAAIASTNLLFKTESMALNDALKNEEQAGTYVRSLFSLLYGKEDLDGRFSEHGKILGSMNAAKWPIATYFLFLRFPDKYLFVKPEPTKSAAECSGFEISYEPRVNWTTYSKVLKFGKYLEEKLKASGLTPVDMIDVQSFMWCIAPNSSKYSQGGKKVVQRDFLRQLVRQFGMNESRLIAEYAAAERSGAVPRFRNEKGLSQM